MFDALAYVLHNIAISSTNEKTPLLTCCAKYNEMVEHYDKPLTTINVNRHKS